MIRPAEMRAPLKVVFDGAASTTTEVWDMLTASRDGNIARVRELVAHNPVLAACKYNYIPPLHLAIRENHIELVRLLLAHGGLVPNYRSYPFLDTFAVLAEDRGHDEIVGILAEVAANPTLAPPCPAPR
jgi:ankyrin repeat protein